MLDVRPGGSCHVTKAGAKPRTNSRNSPPHCPWEWFRADGTRLRAGHFDAGVPVGEGTTYDKQGQVFKATRILEVANSLRSDQVPPRQEETEAALNPVFVSVRNVPRRLSRQRPTEASGWPSHHRHAAA